MNSFFPFLDIIILGLLALFLGFRLKNLLGDRSGYGEDANKLETYNETKSDNNNVINLNKKKISGEGLEVLKKGDPNFSEEEFIIGAKQAFKIIIEAFVDSDVEKLKPLIDYELLKSFTKSISEREARQEKQFVDIISIIKLDIINISLNDNVASISIKIESEQIKYTIDKNDKIILLYTHDKEEHHSLIKTANDKGYDVLVLDGPLSSHYISKMEQDLGVSFARVDADTLDNIIPKDEEIPSKLSKEEEEKLKPIFENIAEKEKFTIQIESLSETEKPVLITQSEFMRRMKEQQALGGGGMHMMGNLPEMFNLVVNANHSFTGKILKAKKADKEKLAKQAFDLALLSQGMLKGKDLTDFVERSYELI